MTEKEIATVDSLRKEGISSLKDSHGNPRFIEGAGSIVTTIEGMTITYNKWSLSGSHIMFVLAGTFNKDAVLPKNTDLSSFTLPSWMLNKIIPVWGNNIESKTTFCYDEDWVSQSITIILRKVGNIKLRALNGVTFTGTRHFRIQFDLLIDDE